MIEVIKKYFDKNLSIVILTYNSNATIFECIQSIIAASPVQCEIIVVDGGSTDNTIKSIISLDNNQIKIIEAEKPGFAYARNLGVLHAQGKYILFIDSDLIVMKDSIVNILRTYLESDDDKIAVVGGIALSYNRENIVSLSQEIFLFGSSYSLKQTKVSSGIATMMAAYRKEILLKIGLFDESFGILPGEDLDINYRLRKNGYILLKNPNVKVYHKHPQNVTNLYKKWFNYGKGFEYFVKKNFVNDKVNLSIYFMIMICPIISFLLASASLIGFSLTKDYTYLIMTLPLVLTFVSLVFHSFFCLIYDEHISLFLRIILLFVAPIINLFKIIAWSAGGTKSFLEI
ncbi:MAG: glycosyltransferase family 2 protein [Methanothrix sp.]